jgi:PEP-CTERM motif
VKLRFNIPNTAAVPEPATWAMMLFGFGLVGSAMRRSRRSVAIV